MQSFADSRKLAESLLSGDPFPEVSSQEELEDVILSLKHAFEGSCGMTMLLSPEGICLLRRGLNSASGGLQREFVLEQLSRFVTSEDGVSALVDSREQSPLLSYFFESFFDRSNLKAYTISKEALLQLAKAFESRAAELFFAADSLYFRQLVSGRHHTDELVQFRFFEFFASLATLSDALFNLLVENNFLHAILEELANPNSLIRLNAFALIATFCQTDRSADFLNLTGTTDRLLCMLCEDGNDTCLIQLSSLLCLLGELFSKSNYAYIHLLDGDRKLPFFQSLLTFLSVAEERVILSALFCLSKLCTTEVGLSDVVSVDDQRDAVNSRLVPDWLQHVRSSSSELRVASLKYLAMIWDRDWSEAITQPTKNLNLHFLLYTRAGEGQDTPLIDYMLHVASHGSSEEKHAVLEVVRGLGRYKWGLEIVVQCHGFSTWILDRSTEGTKIGHELKYAVVVRFTSNPHCQEILGFDLYHQYKLYLRQGPFYHIRDYAVAVKSTTG